MKYKLLKKSNILLILFFFLIILVHNTIEDLPVHCLKHQIVGKWKIKATDLFSVKTGHQVKCGHDEPSREETSFKAKANTSLRKKFYLELFADDHAELKMNGNKLIGNWTMVYDEGFEIRFDEFSFFSFSNYTIENDIEKNLYKYKSFCYSTCVGWYRNKNNSRVGCYIAEKVGVNKNTVLYFNTKKMKLTNNKRDQTIKNLIEPMRFLQYNFNIKYVKINNEQLLKALEKIKKNWTISLYPHYLNKSIEELNSLAGNKKVFKSQQTNSKVKGYTFRFKNIKVDSRVFQTKDAIEKEEISLFPKNFDWKDKIRNAGNQGSCGSCYAWAAMRMLESRLKIHYDVSVKLSVQHTLDCSYYNQGCKGGYSYLALKFGNEFELVPEDCHPYKAKDGACLNTCDITKLDFIYRVSNYKFLGGSYGKCSEKLMMEELQKNGPFVVSIEPDFGFMFYKSGIYNSVDDISWIKQGLTKPEWQKVDHSVLLVGWGEDEDTKEKFWLIQNSWGPDWGENGFFKIKRGVDELAVESICEVGYPTIVINNKKEV